MPIANEYAFPFEHHQKFSIHDPVISSQGLSKQEVIAAMALQGMLSNPQVDLTQMGAEYRTYLTQSAAVLATELLQLLADPYALQYDGADAGYGEADYVTDPDPGAIHSEVTSPDQTNPNSESAESFDLELELTEPYNPQKIPPIQP
jgi:hypothetical protein